MSDTVRNRGDVQDFADLAEATAWLDAHGYVYGSMQREDPIGVMPTPRFLSVAKWRGLTARERKQCVAVLTVLPQDLSTPPGMSCAPVYVQPQHRPWRLTWQRGHKEATP